MEMFYRVTSVDYSWYNETQEFDEEDEAIAYAERCWAEGEGGCTEVKVERVEIEDDCSSEWLTKIWERNIDMGPELTADIDSEIIDYGIDALPF